MFFRFNFSADQGLQSQLAVDFIYFLPELILCGAIVVMLLLRLFKFFDQWHLGPLALGLTGVALATTGMLWYMKNFPKAGNLPDKEIFNHLLVFDNFTIFLRLFLLAAAGLVIWMSMLTGIPDREDSADFYCLLLGATVGMCLMASANHLLMVYIGVEMASLPSYALAGFLKGKRQGSEAALKYVVYGGGASGIMLYGISLLAGMFGTAYLPDLARAFTASYAAGPIDPILILGALFILIGIAFKLAAVPFHFWCPDVFEGAAAEVAGFLSVASKGAAVALLARFTLVLTAPGQVVSENVRDFLVPTLSVLAVATATFGNLAAYAQTNLKRLLAYSTIAHAGYMMMGLATLKPDGVGAVLTYLPVYLVMNLGAFAVVAFLRNQTGSEDLSAFRGLVQRSPVLVITLGVFLLSLLGIPPLAGFFAKFQVFSAVWNAAREYQFDSPLGMTMLAVLVIGGLNTVLSLVYYIKVLRVMVLDKPLEEVEQREARPLAVPFGASFYATLLALLLVAISIVWGPLVRESYQRGAGPFRQKADQGSLVPTKAKG
jgi:NADH-quinone oxidoreductase subunit N